MKRNRNELQKIIDQEVQKFCTNVKEQRCKRKLTQEQLFLKCENLSFATIRRIERKASANITLDTIIRIADGLKIHYSELFK